MVRSGRGVTGRRLRRLPRDTGSLPHWFARFARSLSDLAAIPARWREHGPWIFDGFSRQLPDIDPEETSEWLDSFDAVVDARGRTRGQVLMLNVKGRAHALQVPFPATISTPYINTIPPEQEPWFPGDEHIERR